MSSEFMEEERDTSTNPRVFDSAGEPVGRSVDEDMGSPTEDARNLPPPPAGPETVANRPGTPIPRPNRLEQAYDPYNHILGMYDQQLTDPNLPDEDRSRIVNERNRIEIYRRLNEQSNQSALTGEMQTLTPEEEQRVGSKEEQAWRRGKLYLAPRTETGGMVEVEIDRDPGKLLGYMRNILNQIEETYEAQGKPEIRVDLQKLFLVMPVIKSWGEIKPIWMSPEDHKKWKGIINKAGKIMSEEFEYRFALQQNWVKFANANAIDDAVGGMAGLYTDQLNYILVKSRKNNLLVTAAFEWMDKNSEEFLLGTPEHQAQMRKRLLSDLKHGWNPKNKIVEDIEDPETREVTPGQSMDLIFTDEDYQSAQLVGEHMYVITARLAQKNFLVDKQHRYKLDPKNPVDAATIKSGDVALAYSPGSGGQGQINNSKAMEWLHTQTANYKDTYGGFPVADLLEGVNFNDKDFLSILPSQIGDYYKDRLYEIYRVEATDAASVGAALSKAGKDSVTMVEAVFGIQQVAGADGKKSYPKIPDLSEIAFSREELVDHAENETDPELKAKYQKRLDKLEEIFKPIQNKYGVMPKDQKPELLLKQWEDGEFIDFNWQTIWRPGRWASYNVGLPQKVADSIQKPGGFMIAKTAKSLVEFAKQYDGIKGARFPIQQKIVENYVKWRLKPPPGIGKLRPIDAEAYIANLSTQLNLKDGAVKELKDQVVKENPGFEGRVLWNHAEPDDVFNAFIAELLTKMFLAGISGK